jgi:soluble lytic murein transglycosylase-like protein
MDPRDKALLKIVFILIFALLIYTLFVRPAGSAEREIDFKWNAPREVYNTKLDKFLTLYFSKSSPRKLINARKLIPVVLDASERHNVNPVLIASIISYESTWNYAAIGALGEIGLMQVNNKIVGKDPSNQLDVGISMLKDSYARCGSVIGAISYYATGHTCKPYKGAEKRIALARKIEAL